MNNFLIWVFIAGFSMGFTKIKLVIIKQGERIEALEQQLREADQ